MFVRFYVCMCVYVLWMHAPVFPPMHACMDRLRQKLLQLKSTIRLSIKSHPASGLPVSQDIPIHFLKSTIYISVTSHIHVSHVHTHQHQIGT